MFRDLLLSLVSLAGLFAIVFAENAPGWPFDVTTLTAPDNSITAKFVSLGATMTELWVSDKFGSFRDVVLGYDDNTKLLTDPIHPYFNPIVGRYANRIKNGTFSIPITKNAQPDGPNVFHIPTNEHGGLDTLHGGTVGWDRRNWTITAKSATSVTYKHLDPGDEGFPGNVTVFVMHRVENSGILKTTMHASATALTPIMVSQHINLNAFQQGSNDILNHTLRIDGAKVVATDSLQVPTGPLIEVKGTAYDFQEPRQIGSQWNETVGYCGPGCQGYDNCWIYNKNESSAAGVSLWSTLSGIRLDVTTDQRALQFYSGNTVDQPRKAVHGGPALNYTRWSTLVLEQQNYIDAINTPEWGVDEIYGPGRDFEWSSTYNFSVVH
ncbi:galactose mutarotase-like protein [Phellopilus nigrolimitatus]|nr:galactose mutarotase-like protein [Phellopilus nigrolimitatus]